MMKRPFLLLLLTLFLFSATACSSPTAPLPTPDSGNSGFNSDSDGNGNQATDPDNNGTQTGDPDNNSGNSGGNSEKPQIGRNETILEKDANGNILKTEEIGSDGTKTHRSYTAAGKLKQEEIWNTDGSHIVRELNDKGLVAFLTSDTADGARTAIGYTYHANGTLATESKLESSGNACNRYYNEEGLLTKEETRNGLSDRITRELTYHANGTVATETISSSSRTVRKNTYDKSGTLTHSLETHADSSKEECSYYPNGRCATRVITDRYGKVERWTYTEDGTSGSGTSEAGTCSETYHSNGKLATRRFDAAAEAQLNYRWEEHTYDDRGNLLTHTKMQTNDTLCVSTYHSNGSYTSVFTDAEGNKYTEYWYKDDLLGGITIDGSEWGTKVPDDYSGFSGR